MKLSELYVIIRARVDEYKRALLEVRGDMKRTAGDADRDAAALERSFRKHSAAAAVAWKSAFGNLRTVGLATTTGISAPLAAAGVAAVRAAMAFEQGSNVIQVTAKATAAQIAELNAVAMKLGSDKGLRGSAQDAQRAMLELIRAGLTMEQAMQAARSSLELASAGQIDFAKAANTQASAMLVFKLRAEDAAKVSDLLTNASNLSLASIDQVADAFQMAAAVAAQTKVPIEDLTAAVAIMASKGLQGSDAGTAFKTMLLSISAPSKDAAKWLKFIGVEAYDATGKLKPIGAILRDFERHMATLNDRTKTKALSEIFGTDGIRAISALLSAGSAEFEKVKGQMSESGSAAKQASAQMSGLKGAIENLGEEWQTFLTGEGKNSIGWLQSLVEMASKAIQAMQGLSNEAKTGLLAAGIAGPVIASVSQFGLAVMQLKAARDSAKALKAMSDASAVAGGAAAVASGQVGGLLANLVKVGWLTKLAKASPWLVLGGLAANEMIGAYRDQRATRMLPVPSAPAPPPAGASLDDWRAYAEQEDQWRARSAPTWEFAPMRPDVSKIDGFAGRLKAQTESIVAGLTGVGEKKPKTNPYDDLLKKLFGQPNDRRNNPAGWPGADNGKGGKAKLTEHARAAAELAQEMQRLAREQALLGDGSARAAMLWEMQHGSLRKLTAAERAQGLAVAESLDHAKAQTEAQTELTRRQVEAANAGAKTEAQRVANEQRLDPVLRKQPMLIKAISLASAMLVDQLRAEEEARERVAQRTREQRDAAEQLAKTLGEEASARAEGKFGRRDRREREARRVLAGARGEVNPLGAALVLGQATALDEAEAADRLAESTKRAREWWETLIGKVKAYQQELSRARMEEAKARREGFEDYMRGVTLEMAKLGGATEEATLRMQLLQQSFGKDTGLVDAAVAATMELNRLQRQADEAKKLIDRVAGAFETVFNDILDNGFRNFASDLLNGVRQLVADIAREILLSQIRGAITGFLGRLFSGGAGASNLDASTGAGNLVSVAGRAAGGPVARGVPYLVGERGPELFVPSRSGRIEPSVATGPVIHLNINVTVPEGGQPRRTADQVAQEVGLTIRRVLGRTT